MIFSRVSLQVAFISVLLLTATACTILQRAGTSSSSNGVANNNGSAGSNGNVTGDNANSTMATNQTTQPTTGSSQTTANSRDIGGEYDVTGTNPDGGEYSGTLLVEKKGEAYRFSWTSGKNSYDGVGVRMENAVTVSFTDGTSGQGCGAAQYWLNSDGTLEGKIGYWGVDNVGTEKATPTGPTTYNVTGTGPDGTAYTAKLTITPEGDGNRFHWSGGRTNEGYGLRFKDVVAVGFGGKLCSWVGYDIEDDGSLRGRWGFSGRSVYGKEFATPRKKVGS